MNWSNTHKVLKFQIKKYSHWGHIGDESWFFSEHLCFVYMFGAAFALWGSRQVVEDSRHDNESMPEWRVRKENSWAIPAQHPVPVPAPQVPPSAPLWPQSLQKTASLISVSLSLIIQTIVESRWIGSGIALGPALASWLGISTAHQLFS